MSCISPGMRRRPYDGKPFPSYAVGTGASTLPALVPSRMSKLRRPWEADRAAPADPSRTTLPRCPNAIATVPTWGDHSLERDPTRAFVLRPSDVSRPTLLLDTSGATSWAQLEPFCRSLSNMFRRAALRSVCTTSVVGIAHGMPVCAEVSRFKELMRCFGLGSLLGGPNLKSWFSGACCSRLRLLTRPWLTCGSWAAPSVQDTQCGLCLDHISRWSEPAECDRGGGRRALGTGGFRATAAGLVLGFDGALGGIALSQPSGKLARPGRACES